MTRGVHKFGFIVCSCAIRAVSPAVARVQFDPTATSGKYLRCNKLAECVFNRLKIRHNAYGLKGSPYTLSLFQQIFESRK
jgi:hypothetical protein